ncbi:MAG: exo-alpha-sialidase [Saprospiraceae bacterium]|nr:exo-alpha-sialidase [Saprospiraceae bacterium]
MKFHTYLFLIILLGLLTIQIQAQNGKALSLNGVDGFMRVVDHDDLDIDVGENFSITLWFQTQSNANFYRIISKRLGGGGTLPGYEMITQSGGGAYGMNLRSVSNVNSGPPFGQTNVTNGSWHHLAMVVDATNNTATIYVDGDAEQQSNVSAIGAQSFANDVDLLIGTEVLENIFLPGMIDEVRLWSIPLSELEIEADMNNLVDGSEDDLIASWDFEDVNGNIVPDLKGNHPGTLNGGAIIFDPNSPMEFASASVIQRNIPVGQGEKNEGVVAVNVQTVGNLDPIDLTKIDFSINGTTSLNDIEQIQIYYTGGTERFSPDALFGSASPANGLISVAGTQTLNQGNNFFWLAYDLIENAVEGNVIDGEVISVEVNGVEEELSIPSVVGSRLILLEHKVLFSSGDYGSVNYRIPAITTALDGTLIAVGDARVDQAGDLPNNIDLLARRSTDMGETWSDAVLMADFGQFGASDPALVIDRNTGDILCLFASHSGLFQSTPSNKIRFQVSRSQDNGLTWSAPEEFSNDIYDSSWYGAWVASGSAHQTRSGRIIASVGVRQNSSNDLTNFMIFSDDGGYNWDFMPNEIFSYGNESKIIELDNGDLMLNGRNQTPDLRRIHRSSDGGQTWSGAFFQPELLDPFVNGDIIRYTSILDEFDKSRLLFSIASHPTQRVNMKVFVSYDEADTWPTSKVIYEGRAGYSSLTILEDGTIGLFYENGEYETYQLHFARFSLDWLTDGTDSYTPASAVNEEILSLLNLQVFPNPTYGKLNIEMEIRETMNIESMLMDVSGNRIKPLFNEEIPVGKYTKAVQLDGLSSGKYIIQFKVNENIFARKVIILK